MTLQHALLVTRKRQLRPESHGRASGFISVFLLLVIFIRYGTNLYLSCFLYPNNSAFSLQTARFFLRVNLAYCSFFLGTVIPLMSYRGMAHSSSARRLHFFPLTQVQQRRAVLAVAFRSILLYGTIVLSFLSWFFSPLRSNAAVLSDPVLFLLTGIFCAGLVLLFCLQFQVREQSLVFLETGILFLFFLANPDFRLPEGKGLLLLFNSFRVQEQAGTTFFLVPITGSLALMFSLLLSWLFGKVPGKQAVKLPFDLALYWRRLPRTVFFLFSAVELILIFTNPDLEKTVRNLVLFFLVFRVVYFVQYAVKLETRIVNRLAVPISGSRRWIYGRAAAVHSVFCILPLFFYVLILF